MIAETERDYECVVKAVKERIVWRALDWHSRATGKNEQALRGAVRQLLNVEKEMQNAKSRGSA